MIYFILTFIVAYSLYYIFTINKYDKNGKLKKHGKLKTKIFTWLKLPLKEKDEAKLPSEVEVIVVKYKVDLKKVDFKKLLKIVGFVCSFDIALMVTIISCLKIKNMYAMLGVGALLVFPIILISFWLTGKYLKKKGMTKNV